MMTYSVNGTQFTSYLAAIAAARQNNSDVIEIATGLIRWTPPKSVSKKRMNQYAHQKAAYEAQERMKNKNK